MFGPLPISALVVDDHALIARLIAGTLRTIGLQQVDCALDGQHALNKLDETPFGLVIADYHMAGMNGLQLLERVRDRPDTALAAFIMMARNEDATCKARAMEAGADAFLIKPFRPDVLRRTVEEALGDWSVVAAQ